MKKSLVPAVVIVVMASLLAGCTAPVAENCDAVKFYSVKHYFFTSEKDKNLLRLQYEIGHAKNVHVVCQRDNDIGKLRYFVETGDVQVTSVEEAKKIVDEKVAEYLIVHPTPPPPAKEK